MVKKVVFINQVTGPLFIDILNEFSLKTQVILYTGSIEKTYTSLNKNIIIRKLTEYKRKNFFLRIITWTAFYMQSVFFLLFDLNSETKLFLTSNPPIAPFITFFFKSRYDILIYDIYPDILVNFTNIKETGLLYKMFSYLNKKVYRKSDHIYTISEVMKDVLTIYVEKSKITVVPCWADTNFIKPIPKGKNLFVKKYDLHDKFLVMYSGNLGISHDIESILEAAVILKERKEIKFIIIGEGVKKNLIKLYIEKFDLDNVLSLPFQNPSFLPSSLTSCDVAIVSLGKGVANYAVPSKTYYFMAAGAAILAISDEGSELATIILKEESGCLVPPGSPKKVVKCLTHYFNNLDALNKAKLNSRKASHKYTPENAKRFVNL